MPSLTALQVFRFKAGTSTPSHRSFWYLDDFLQNLVMLKGPCRGTLVQVVVSFHPGHQPPQWVPGGLATVQMRPVMWALSALNIRLILVLGCDRTSTCDCSFCTMCIGCLCFICRQPCDRRPDGLRPTLCVSPPSSVPPTLPSSPSFP